MTVPEMSGDGIPFGRNDTLADGFPVKAQKRRKTAALETELFHIGLILLAAGTGLWALYHFLFRRFLPEIPCFFTEIVGIYCPGCGGTRAFRALVQGKFLLALWYHPLVPYMVLMGGGFMITQGLNRMGIRKIRGWQFHSWYLYGAVALIVCNFLLKNALRLIWGITM